LNNFDSALTNLQSSTFTTSTSIEIPLDINVRCNNNGYSIFVNENNDIEYIIASKEKLKNKIYVWYQPYNIPFHATNFYYMVDDNPLNIFTNNVNLLNSMKEEMPENFKSKLNVYQGDKIIINGDENKGILSVDGNNIPYLGKEMLYGVMLSGNYSCFYDQAIKEIDRAVLIYENKARVLGRSGCNYNLVLSRMNALRDLNNINPSIIDDIENLNRNLISINCPALF